SVLFFFSSRRRHTRSYGDWSSDVCSSDLCWRRLRDWQEAGIWDLIHFALLDWLSRCSRLDWSKAILDSCSVRAVFGGSRPARIRSEERRVGKEGGDRWWTGEHRGKKRVGR